MGIGHADAVVGVVLERLNGVVSLVFVVAIGIGIMGEQIANSLLRNALLMMLPLSLLGLIFLCALDRLPAVFRRWPLNRLDGLASVTRRTLCARRACEGNGFSFGLHLY